MLDYFVVFHKGGLVVWRPAGYDPLKGSPINSFVQKVIMQDRSGETRFSEDTYALRWAFANEYDLIFVVVFQVMFPVLYADKLLERVRDAFVGLLKELNFSAKDPRPIDTDKFAKQFLEILVQCEQERSSKGLPPPMPTSPMSVLAPPTPPAEPPHREQRTPDTTAAVSPVGSGPAPAPTQSSSGAGDGPISPSKPAPRPGSVPGPRVAGRPGGAGPRRGGSAGALPGGGSKPVAASSGPPSKPKKQMTVWGNKKSASELALADDDGDRGAAPARADGEDEPLPEGIRGDLPDLDTLAGSAGDGADDDADEAVDGGDGSAAAAAAPVVRGGKPASTGTGTGTGAGAASAAAGKRGGLGRGLFSMLRSLTGTRVLTREDLEAPLQVFRDGLMERNVAAPVCDQLCESVISSLDGKRLETLTVTATVRRALEEALTRILTPRRNIDVLRDALAAKSAGRPYVVTFCGVNGVGKSTSLAKVAYWLLNNGLSVMVAACDTFRSGAVEQLEVHVRRLSQHGHRIRLFGQGYGKEPALVARAAVNAAREEAFDVVLIDTAGRMQHNETLMRALAKLVNENQPDLVLFVGEALVGNDGVDQLVSFSQALTRYGVGSDPRTVDGVFLTKFDTVDEKMGAAVSMVYASGAPIVFVGVGQHYTSVRKLNVGAVVKALLS